MKTRTKYYFLLEAAKVTLFCLIIVGIFRVLGADTHSLLILFYMVVMSNVATFSPLRTPPGKLLVASTLIIASILVGGMLGYYCPYFARIFSILYAALMFLVCKTKSQSQVGVTSAVVVIVFIALPFSAQAAIHYFFSGLLLLLLLPLYDVLFDKLIHKSKARAKIIFNEGRKESALTASLALAGALIIFYALKQTTHLSHLYWIPLTIMLVIQGSQQRTLKASIGRILINTLGAVLVIVCMTYILPPAFWVNFVILLVLLFTIFAFAYSFFWRTLLSEVFVLCFIHLLGQYHTVVALDRLLFTFIGGLLVIIASVISFFILSSNKLFSLAGSKKQKH